MICPSSFKGSGGAASTDVAVTLREGEGVGTVGGALGTVPGPPGLCCSGDLGWWEGGAFPLCWPPHPPVGPWAPACSQPLLGLVSGPADEANSQLSSLNPQVQGGRGKNLRSVWGVGSPWRRL